MKNVFKKLFSLMLVAVMLVSVLPMTAMAAEEGVTVYVKDETGNIVDGEVNSGVDYTLEEYLAYAVPNYEDTYNVVKYYYKDANGATKDPAAATDKAANGSTVIVKLAHKDPTVVLNIELDGAVAQKSFTVSYGDTVKLDESLVTRFFDVDLKSFDCKVQVTGEYQGQTIKVKGYTVIDVEATSVKEDNNEDNEDNEDNDKAKTIKFGVKVDGEVKKDRVNVEPGNGKSATVKDMLYYHFDKKWDDKYDFDHYWIEGEGSKTHSNAGDAIATGKTVWVALETEDDDDEDNTPDTPSTTAKKDLTIQVSYNGKVYTEYYDTYKVDTKVEIIRSMIEEAFDDYDRDVHHIDRIEAFNTRDNSSGKTYQLGNDLKMDAHKTLKFTLSKRTTTDDDDEYNSKFPGTVYLHIYRDGKIDKPYKTYSSDDYSGVRTLMADDKISKREIRENFLPKYFSVVDSDEGFGIDGLYWNTEFQKNFVNDTEKFDSVELSTKTTRGSDNESIHISLMLTNAKAKSSSKADSSNPKTGDSIFMTMTVMTLSATALAGAYIFNKKRMVK